jgi:anti-sigma regulatory factor (Ser/Thr protein kinase)
LRELALHLLDIVENSVSAGAKNITIEVMEDTRRDRLRMSVIDDGCGMDADTVAKITDPFVTSRTTRKVGLGIPLLKAAAEACNGFFHIQSTPNLGTRVDVEFQRSHIDRMPLGDLAGTFLGLLVGSPEIHWIFHYCVDDRQFEFDDAPIKQELEGIPLSEPEVLKFLRNTLELGIQDAQSAN